MEVTAQRPLAEKKICCLHPERRYKYLSEQQKKKKVGPAQLSKPTQSSPTSHITSPLSLVTVPALKFPHLKHFFHSLHAAFLHRSWAENREVPTF